MIALGWLAGLILSASPLCGLVYLRADPDGVGTGWIVDAERRWILTCRHVVGEQSKVEVFFPQFRQGELVAEASEYLGRRQALRESGRLVLGRVLRTSDQFDTALIEVPSLSPGIRELRMANRCPALGESIISFGHGGDLDTLWNATAGIVRQSGSLADGYYWQAKRLGAAMPALVFQSPIGEGDSGGPVLNDRGEVVGMISALRRRAPLAAVGPDATAILQFLNRPQPAKDKREPNATERLARFTVWLRPQATDVRCAGLLVNRERRWILTAAAGIGSSDRVGVTFPRVAEEGTIRGELAIYRDTVGLHLAKRWCQGTVLLRDPVRDLAIVQLDSLPPDVEAIPISHREPALLDAVRTINHPLGLEFAFVAGAGNLRQRGTMRLSKDSTAAKVETNLFQLPATGNAPGGPIVDDRGELVGIQAAKEAPLQQAYAASTAELRAFLANAPFLILHQSVESLVRELDSFDKLAAWSFLFRKEYASAIRAYPGCIPARLARGGMEDADAVILRDPANRQALRIRAEAKLMDKDYKGAIADIQRRLDLDPGDRECREFLIRVRTAQGDLELAEEERRTLKRLGK